MSKREVSIKYHGQKYKEFTGRLLGLITDEEFFALATDIPLRTKILTAETTNVEDINKAGMDAVDKRLVISMRTLNGDPIIKKLFVSERIKLISSYIQAKNELGILGQDEHWFTVTES